MKLQSCCMIRCITLNTVSLETLRIKLNKVINLYFPHAQITLKTNAPYWKYPEENVIIYNLSDIKLITVSEVIAAFPLSWEHKEGRSYNVKTQQIENLEDAVWSKNCHPDEQF